MLFTILKAQPRKTGGLAPRQPSPRLAITEGILLILPYYYYHHYYYYHYYHYYYLNIQHINRHCLKNSYLT